VSDLWIKERQFSHLIGAFAVRYQVQVGGAIRLKTQSIVLGRNQWDLGKIEGLLIED
jgi:hypothetical protein